MEFAEFIRTPTIDGVVLHRSPSVAPVEGTLCVTGHHLILSSRTTHNEELWLLHRNIDSVEKRLTGSQGVLSLKCKDFEIIQLEMPTVEDCLNLAMSIEALSNIENVNHQYPFFHRPMPNIVENGWKAFSVEDEFATRIQAYTEEWRLSTVNFNYDVCPSYPKVVCVPKTVDDETLKLSASFRQGGRFPVLAYYHKTNGLCLMRSSQPLPGPNRRRCREDSGLVNSILGMGRRGYIVDTRSQNVAKLAQAKGGGVELEVHYPQWRRLHQPIERHPALRECLVKLIYACFDSGASTERWLSRLDSSGWLTQVKAVLVCACVAAQCLDKEAASVLVHGSEGTDSTLQVTSLTQILLDPDCRTIRGFEALVEREWLQAGHPFQDRCARSVFSSAKQRAEAPTFLMFLDCVWQVWQQFPLSFEFNEDFLLMLLRHAYASQFGTFLCNRDMERRRYELESNTVSLWSHINKPDVISDYMNPLFEPNKSVIWPSVAPQSLKLWDRMYQRFRQYQNSGDVIWAEIQRIKEHDSQLRSKVVKMRKQLVVLEKEAIDAGLLPPPTAVKSGD